MPAGTRQMVCILLLTFILMWCGLYTVFFNMQKATLWPDDGFFSLDIRDGALNVKLLGIEKALSRDELSLQHFRELLRDTAGAFLSRGESSFYFMKDFLANFLNKNEGQE